MTETVISHVAEHTDWVETPTDVVLVADIMASAMQEPETLSVTARVGHVKYSLQTLSNTHTATIFISSTPISYTTLYNI